MGIAGSPTSALGSSVVGVAGISLALCRYAGVESSSKPSSSNISSSSSSSSASRSASLKGPAQYRAGTDSKNKSQRRRQSMRAGIFSCQVKHPCSELRTCVTVNVRIGISIWITFPGLAMLVQDASGIWCVAVPHPVQVTASCHRRRDLKSVT